MGVRYHCDGPLMVAGCPVVPGMANRCGAVSTAMLGRDFYGRPTFLPPPGWKLVDVPGSEAPVLLCPSCADDWNALLEARSPRPRLGVLDGGRGKPDPDDQGGPGRAA